MNFSQASLLQKVHSVAIVTIGGLYYNEIVRDNILLLGKNRPIRKLVVKAIECQNTRQIVRILATKTRLAVDIPFVRYFPDKFL